VSDLSHVYGMFNKAGECLYVGCTRDPKTRAYQHSLTRRFKNCEMRILRSVLPKLATKIERNEITRYRKLGQAKHNANNFWQPKAVKISVSPEFAKDISRFAFLDGKSVRHICDRDLAPVLARKERQWIARVHKDSTTASRK